MKAKEVWEELWQSALMNVQYLPLLKPLFAKNGQILKQVGK